MKLYTGICIFLLGVYVIVPSDTWGMLHIYYHNLGYGNNWLIFIGIFKALTGASLGHVTISLWLRLYDE